MKTLFKMLASLMAFLAAFAVVLTYLGEKAKERKYIVIDEKGNELF
ncbi:MAG: hypothetical protein IJ410_07625 [Oscillospiraceae bacterium]|nr:hypothetical protein [Oscillospiraceae bacterium]